MLRRLAAILLVVVPLAASAADVRGPLSPAEALPHFRLPPGLRLELVASEPRIESPVAMAFDENGILWVVEMRDYPNGPKPGQKPEGRIKRLEDRDGDGVFETSTIFADNLLFANGLLPWKGGLVVTAAPHVVFLQDTDGDGKADKKEVLYEGFAIQNPQLRVSHPVLGVDGWVYVANGLRGGQVKKTGSDAPPINLSGMDFRFNLLTGEHEAISGLGQYGNTFDDAGNRFVCDNRHHLRHVVIENRYLKKNPFLAAGEPVQDISILEDGPLSSGGKIYPLSKNWTTSSLHVGRFTAACGVLIYRGDLLPKEYHGSAFTCDPTGNLVHQEVLEPHGATFRSRPAKDGVEFLATPDEWFRPVFLTHGPDGALYIVDMYRAVIEHPEFMPTELKNRPDLTLGKERGRIWRVVPDKYKYDPKKSKVFSELNAYAARRQDWGRLLKHPNPWVKTTAQRLLLERPTVSSDDIAEASVEGPPWQRAAALNILEAHGKLREPAVGQQLMEGHSLEVLLQAVRCAERWLPQSEELQEHLVRLAGHPNARLRFQVACSLGAWDNDRILPPLARIALAGADDRWTRLAVASAVPTRAGALLALIAKESPPATRRAATGQTALLKELAALVGARRNAEEVANVLDIVASLKGEGAATWQMTGLEGLAEGMGRRGTQLGAFSTNLPEKIRKDTDALFSRAASLAADAKTPTSERLAAVRLLAHASWPTAEPVLARLFTSDPAQDVRLAAARALAAHPRPETGVLLVKEWRSATPALRREIAEALVRQPDRALVLLAEVEAGRVKPADLDAVRTKQLLNYGRADVRDKARKLLQDTLPADRKKVLAEYQAALKLKGDPKKGQLVFQKNCATCHRVNGIGVDVAPDIADTRTKTPEQLLLDILNPNAAIDANYVNYEVSLKNGRVLTGLVAGETATSLTLRRAENQSDVVLRQDIEEIRSTGVSLMPDGLEKTIPLADMADLISFLKNWRYLDGSVPLGTPPP